jgi:hypothetical protein
MTDAEMQYEDPPPPEERRPGKMTKEDWKIFNRKVLLMVSGFIVGYIVASLIVENIVARNAGTTFRMTFSVVKGETK